MRVKVISFRYMDSPPRADLTWDTRSLTADTEAVLGAPGVAGGIGALVEFVRTAPLGRSCRLAVGGERASDARTVTDAVAIALRSAGHDVAIEHRAPAASLVTAEQFNAKGRA